MDKVILYGKKIDIHKSKDLDYISKAISRANKRLYYLGKKSDKHIHPKYFDNLDSEVGREEPIGYLTRSAKKNHPGRISLVRRYDSSRFYYMFEEGSVFLASGKNSIDIEHLFSVLEKRNWVKNRLFIFYSDMLSDDILKKYKHVRCSYIEDVIKEVEKWSNENASSNTIL